MMAKELAPGLSVQTYAAPRTQHGCIGKQDAPVSGHQLMLAHLATACSRCSAYDDLGCTLISVDSSTDVCDAYAVVEAWPFVQQLIELSTNSNPEDVSSRTKT